jgi:hypothetical protein
MMSYTVMGDAVNLASRLENANKIYGSHSLASEAAIMAAGDAVESREIDRLIVVGQSHPEAVFEIIGRAGELTEKQLELLARYAEGLAAYRARSWDEARRAFSRGAQGGARRWAIDGDGRTCREFSGKPAARRLGRLLAAGSEVAAGRRSTPRETPARRRKIPAAPVRTSSGGCPG